MADRARIPPEAERFMLENKRTFMVTLRRDGSPTAHPMAGFFGGSLYLNVYAASVKSKNLHRDSRICCVVTTPSDADVEAVVYKGNARLVPVDEVFADGVPDGLALARNPRSGGAQEQPEIPDHDQRKIGETAGRVKAGLRVIYEVIPSEVGVIQKVRE